MTTIPAPVVRSDADRRMRALLRIHETPVGVTPKSAENAFSKSILISATRCLLTYVAIPLLGPLLNFSGAVGPVLGILLGIASMVAIIYSMRRFFAADHKFRWKYTAIGGAIIVLLVVQMVIDVVDLAS